MTTTSKLGDFLGRALQNDNPGVSTARDYLGRLTTASDKDYSGIALVNTPNFPPPERANSTAYSLGQRVRVASVNEAQTISCTGTPDTAAYKINVIMRGSTEKTTELTHSSNAAAVTAAIVALPNVEPGDVVVGGTWPNLTVAIQSEQGNVGQIDVVEETFGGGTAPAITTGTTTQGADNRGKIYEATVAGTSHSSAPSLPAVGATVTDGGVTWRRLQ